MKRALLAVLVVPLLAVLGLLAVAFKSDSDARRAAINPCSSGPGSVATVAGGPSIDGYSGEQLANAAAIINAGVPLGVSGQGQRIAVMTAMGESTLRVLTYGDAAGPDSRGLFQQRAAGWGSLADRMDPTISASNFYRALLAVPGWESLAPTEAAHRTQHNADPFYYTRFWAAAVDIVAGLTGGAPAAADAGGLVCSAAPVPAPVVAGGWSRPAVGALTSGFSARINPVTGQPENHLGQDIGAPCGTPIWAAHDGTVISSGPASGFGNWIRVDHGGGVVTVYGHMAAVDLLVRVGDRVAAGQQISRVGREGQATGCHLHFEVHLDGRAVDPLPYLRDRGVAL